LPGGRGGGSEKIVPSCARADGIGAINSAAAMAARLAMLVVRNIVCGFNGRIKLATF
jgi:hypothetical protein